MAPGAARKTSIPVGVVFSTTGSYSTIGTAMLNGALLAVEEINESNRFDFTLDPIIRDPGGEPAAYRVLCEELLRPRALRHIIGCYTSSAAKR